MLAPAKINLYLHVVGRRDDGYHLLDSLVVFAEVGDELTATEAPDLRLDVDGPFSQGLTGDTSNLVMKAALLLRRELGLSQGAHIHLTKYLPLASGIGGGSSDAAATINLLSRLWRAEPDRRQLAKLALSLGADVPVCLSACANFVGGIGEEVTPAGKLPPAWLLLVNPGIPTPTPAVFKARGGAFSTVTRWKEAPKDFGELVEFLARTRNDLTEAATKVTPAIASVLAHLQQITECRIARLSGSGATCFGLFDREEPARRVERHIRDMQPGWWVRAARMMT